MEESKVLFRVHNFRKYFPVKKTRLFQKEQLYVKANDGLNIDIYEGETLGLVGESGCGKSTFGRVMLQLYDQTTGFTIYRGQTIYDLAPQYVEDILKKLPERKKAADESAEKAAAAQKTYESATDPTEQRILYNNALLAEDLAEREYYGIVQLIGGLFVAENLAEVSEVVLTEYQAQCALATAKKQGKDTTEAQKALDSAKHKLETLRQKYMNHPDFSRHDEKLETGIDLRRLSVNEMRVLRKDMQLIFQDPYSSLDARMTVGQIIGEGLLTHKYFTKNGDEMQQYIMNVMEECGLAPYFFHRYPHQFSGGQRQRIGIARSLALRPKFVVCDEAVSALDVSIQSQIINLLLDLKEKQHLTYMFISHDLSVIKYISDRIGVMYLGSLVELTTTAALFAHPMHPYTDALLSAIPTTDADNKKEAVLLGGDIPSPIKPPPGCKFHTRCRFCTDICKTEVPQWREAEPGHFVACHNSL